MFICDIPPFVYFVACCKKSPQKYCSSRSATYKIITRSCNIYIQFNIVTIFLRDFDENSGELVLVNPISKYIVYDSGSR